MIRALLIALALLLVPPHGAHAFFCHYPATHLRGVADVGGLRFVRLDFDIRFAGPECEVEISGRGVCRPVARRTLGVTFTLKGQCPGASFRIVDASYIRRREERVADVVLEIAFGNGDRCSIMGTSPALYFNSPDFGGPLPSLSGTIVCPTTLGSPGVAEFAAK